ncbi:uncharacterized protein LOC132742095 isoform X2 [Ruditapes philippinarum]|uniref:uncharacterized protein LOC132742095 isoform X2 n=1 Tax=Ruditapes philippinarum TaxID=129788 RepID=UPI00295A8DDA|nr:uncharacterized protein LOC132742095 isoform X2 [Ruditapes philippinarum]
MNRMQGWHVFGKVSIINTTTLLLLLILYFSMFDGIPKEDFIEPAFIPNDNTKELSFMCNETFNSSLEENLDVIQNYPRGIADDYLWKVGVNMSEPYRMKEFPVFATAIDRKYYPQSQGLFHSLHKRFLENPKYAKNVKIIVYDLGMTSRQLRMVLKHCKCEIRRFPFDQFPPHVKVLHTYAFKPIIVQQLLMEFGFVWWMDSSVRFTTNDIDSAVMYTKKYSMLYTVSTSDRVELSLTKQTDGRTFKFLGEDRCKFRPFGETWATTVMFHYDRMSRAVVQAWATCALNQDCIAPTGSLEKILCHMEQTFDGRCHRFDQSVLSIITRRLFHEQNVYPLDKTLNDIYVIKRGDIVPYFESCRPIIKCIL